MARNATNKLLHKAKNRKATNFTLSIVILRTNCNTTESTSLIRLFIAIVMILE